MQGRLVGRPLAFSCYFEQSEKSFVGRVTKPLPLLESHHFKDALYRRLPGPQGYLRFIISGNRVAHHRFDDGTENKPKVVND